MSKPLREPLFKTTSFVFHSFREMQAALYGDSKDYFYVRDGHPTLEALEQVLLSYEPADFAWVFSSGMSAISTGLFALLSQGDHVVVQKEIYGPTRLLFEEYLPSFGVSCTFTDVNDVDALEESITPDTELIYLEMPAPFTLTCPPLEQIKGLADKYQVSVMVDNSAGFGYEKITPFADLVAISLSKYPAGDSGILGGALLGCEGWKEPVEMARSTLGGIMMPWDANVLIWEMESMRQRLEVIGSNVYQLQSMLSAHPMLKEVYYPRDINGKSVKMGGFVTVELNISLLDIARFIDNLSLFQKGVFWGGSIPVVTPLLASYRVEVLESWGLNPGLIRFYVGMESPDRLYADIVSALGSL